MQNWWNEAREQIKPSWPTDALEGKEEHLTHSVYLLTNLVQENNTSNLSNWLFCFKQHTGNKSLKSYFKFWDASFIGKLNISWQTANTNKSKQVNRGEYAAGKDKTLLVRTIQLVYSIWTVLKHSQIKTLALWDSRKAHRHQLSALESPKSHRRFSLLFKFQTSLIQNQIKTSLKIIKTWNHLWMVLYLLKQSVTFGHNLQRTNQENDGSRCLLHGRLSPF